MEEAAAIGAGIYGFGNSQDDDDNIDSDDNAVDDNVNNAFDTYFGNSYSDDEDDDDNFEGDADDDDDEDLDDDDDDDFIDHEDYLKNDNKGNIGIDAAHTPTVDNPEVLQFMPTCPITLEPIQRPVVAADGHTYEREAILEWFRNNPHGCCSPMTNQPLSHLKLVPNYVVVKMIEEQKAAQQQQPQVEQQQQPRQEQRQISLNLVTRMTQWKWWFPQQVEFHRDSIAPIVLMETMVLSSSLLRPLHSNTFEAKAPGAAILLLQQEENGVMAILDILTLAFFYSFLYVLFQMHMVPTNGEGATLSYSLPQIVLGMAPFVLQGFVYYYEL